MGDTLQVRLSQAQQMLKGLGFKSAERWDAERCQRKIVVLEEYVTEDMMIGDNDLDNLLDEILFTLSKKGTIEVVNSPAEEQAEPDPDPEAEEEEQEEETNGQASLNVPVDDRSTAPKRRGRPPKAPSTQKAETTLKWSRGDGRSRIAIGARVLIDHGLEKPITEELVQQADDLYVASGGKSNKQTAGFYLRQVRSALVAWTQQMKEEV